jgi:hypothetical protein
MILAANQNVTLVREKVVAVTLAIKMAAVTNHASASAMAKKPAFAQRKPINL